MIFGVSKGQKNLILGNYNLKSFVFELEENCSVVWKQYSNMSQNALTFNPIVPWGKMADFLFLLAEASAPKKAKCE